MAHSVDSFFRNKKIADALKEAIDSPIGSTKRKAAKSLISVLTKVSGKGKYNGQGGPGNPRYSATTPGSASFFTKAPRKDPDYSNMIVFPSPPGPKGGNPMTKSMASSEKGASSATPVPQLAEPGVAMGTPGMSQDQSKPATYSSPDISRAYSDVYMGQGGPGDTLMPQFGTLNPSGVSPTAYADPNKKFSVLSAPGGGKSEMPKAYPNLFKSVGDFFSGASKKGDELINKARYGAPVGVLAPAAPSTPATSSAPAKTTTGEDLSIPNPANSSLAPWANPMSSQQTSSTQTDTSGATSTTGTTPATETSQTGSSSTTKDPIVPTYTDPTKKTPAASDVSKSLAAGVAGNMGATGWAQSVMGDQDLLKQIFPNDPNLPTSPSLTEAVSSLSSTLKDQYNIKELESQLAQMTASGVVLGPMLQTYIQNKDKSLNAIYSQMQNAQTQMLHSDKGNPYEATIWSRYSDYLNNLYNSQNASYADFFNKSTTMYSNALNALDSTLNQALTSYTNDLSTGVAATEADYNRIYQALTDMYTAVQDAPIRELNLQMLKDQAALAHKQLVGSSTGLGLGEGDWTSEYKKLTDLGILFDNATTEGGTSNARYGTLLPDVTDVGGMIQTILSDDPKVGVDGALYIIGQAFQKTLQAAGSDPSAAIQTANRIQNMIVQGVYDGYVPSQMGLNIAQSLIPAISRSVSDFVVSTPGMENTAKEAMIEALVGSGWMGKKVPSQPDFQKKYSETLGKDLTDAVYLQIQDTKARIEAAQNASGSGPAATSPYAGMTVQQINQSFADAIKSFATPQEVGDYLGSLVAPFITGAAISTLQPVGG